MPVAPLVCEGFDAVDSDSSFGLWSRRSWFIYYSCAWMRHIAFMRIWTLLIVSSCLILGCSKHSAAARPKLQDLGTIEISDSVTNRFELKEGRVCLVSSALRREITKGNKRFLFDGPREVMTVVVDETNSDGAARRILEEQIPVVSDKWVELRNVDVDIKLTPHF